METAQKASIAACFLLITILAVFTLIIPIISPGIFLLLAIIIGIIPFLLSVGVYIMNRTNTNTLEELTTQTDIINPNTAAGKTTEERKLNTMISAAQTRLHHISAVFPFDFFPDEVIIELKQVIIVQKNFFFSQQEHSIIITDILSPVVESSLLFAKLRIEIGPGGFDQNPPTVSFLRKKEALRARHIIMGLLVCEREKIDLTKLTPVEILRRAEEIGSTHA